MVTWNGSQEQGWAFVGRRATLGRAFTFLSVSFSVRLDSRARQARVPEAEVTAPPVLLSPARRVPLLHSPQVGTVAEHGAPTENHPTSDLSGGQALRSPATQKNHLTSVFFFFTNWLSSKFNHVNPSRFPHRTHSRSCSPELLGTCGAARQSPCTADFLGRARLCAPGRPAAVSIWTRPDP